MAQSLSSPSLQKPNGQPLSREEREKLLKPYLPSPRARSPAQSKSAQAYPKQPHQSRSLISLSLRDLLNLLLHKIIFHFLQFLFSVYIRIRQTHHAIGDQVFSVLYYHHRTPALIRRDVSKLGKIPRHLSVVVELRAEGSTEALHKLVLDVSELAAWCACAGIEILSVYERTGTLKSHIPELHHETLQTFSSYFPRPQRPSLHIRAPNRRSYSPSPSPSRSPSPSPYDGSAQSQDQHHLNLVLLSSHDGRDTLVDLTKTLAEMSQKGKIAPADVTQELIAAEIKESCECGEPDLLVVMAESGEGRLGGKRRKRGKKQKGEVSSTSETGGAHSWAGDAVCLRGYPPWQVRLTEIFQIQDSSGIGYQIFLRALHRYAKAEMRFGR